MSSLADRLRGIVKPLETRVETPGVSASCAADVLGGEWCEAGGHRFLVVDRKYAPGHRHGAVAIADAAPPDEGWERLSMLEGGSRAASVKEVRSRDSRCLFLDLETTGLAGGAGTYAFLVGLGWFEACTFRVKQFFLSSYAAERVLLQAVRDVAAETGTVVTYNGKSFDLPVLETRYVLNRMETPFAGMPHVDMLHPARRLWRVTGDADDEASALARRRGDTGSRQGDSPGRRSSDSVSRQSDAGGCRLMSLEQSLCGHHREGDVPGFEIPARYFHYVRTGEARPLEAVLEHNRLDLLSLALLTARAARLLEDGPDATHLGREALGLGQLYDRAGLTDAARAAFVRAASLPSTEVVTRAEALRALAMACRRARDYDAAAEAWRAVLELRGCPAAIAREATEALAVHHEHRLRDPQSARTFALRSLRLPVTPTRREALEHRLARLNRKLGEEVPGAVPLF